MPGTSPSLAPSLLDWVADSTGGADLITVDRRPGGGRREAWAIDVRSPSGTVEELFLRYDRMDPTDRGDPFTLHREAAFYRALEGTGVPIPRIVAVHPTEQAILSDRVPGQAWFSRLTDPVQREAIASDFMRILALMHAVDPTRLELRDQDASLPLPALVEREVDTWEGVYRGSGRPEPLIEIALRWVRSNIPSAEGPVVIVQGDTGPGNFLFEDGRVTAVLDLELGHLGDPHDDLAWVSVRAVQEPFTDLRDRFADYERASGMSVDPARIAFYRVLAELRIVILGHRSSVDPDVLGEVGNGLAYGQLHRRLLVEALAEATGTELEIPEPVDAAPAPTGWLYDAALEQIRQIIVPRSTDPFVVARSKGLARLIKHLRDVERYSAYVAARDLADLEGSLGYRPASVEAGTAAVAELVATGGLPVQEAIRILGRQVAGRTQLLRSAMGSLAERHFDPIGT